jgi:hypothetical protein
VQVPLTKGYRPEIDDTPPLPEDDPRLYMSYIGIPRRTVELGRCNIAHATSTMVSYMVNPRCRHMNAVLQIFGYLKTHLNSRLVFDPHKCDWSFIDWKSTDWSEFYRGVEEEKLPNAP